MSVTFTTITEPEKPKCYDQLRDLSSEDWQTLHMLQIHETEPTVSAPSVDRLREMGLLTSDLRLTDEGRLAFQYQHDFLCPWDYSKDGKVWKSCAVIASDGKGNDILLHAFGPAIDWHIDQYGTDLEELGLGADDPGIWVWEGSMGAVRCYTPDYGEEWDHEANGDLREPTEEEWEHIKQEECPWDKDNLPRWKTDDRAD